MVERKCRWTSFDLNRSERPLTGNLRSRPAMHTQERKLVAISKSGELPAERSNSVGLVEAIGEESYAKWRCQQVVSKPKLAGNCLKHTVSSSVCIQPGFPFWTAGCS